MAALGKSTKEERVEWKAWIDLMDSTEDGNDGERVGLNMEEIYIILLLDVSVFQYEYALDNYMCLNCICQQVLPWGYVLNWSHYTHVNMGVTTNTISLSIDFADVGKSFISQCGMTTGTVASNDGIILQKWIETPPIP